MLIPFAKTYEEPDGSEETGLPLAEVIPIDELSAESLEAAEAELESEGEWPRIA